MSYSLDTNVLVYASDTESPRHRAARDFLARCAAGPEVVIVPWPVAMSYLRIVTDPRILRHPLAPREAEANLESLLGLPHVRVIGEEDGFWQVYRALTAGQVVRGRLVPDAHLAALLVQHGVRRFYTSDVDFRRFRQIEVLDPYG